MGETWDMQDFVKYLLPVLTRRWAIDLVVQYVYVQWVTVRRMYNVYNRIQTNIEPLQGNCQDPAVALGRGY